MLGHALFEIVALYVAASGSEEWHMHWRLYELYAQLQTSASSVPEASVSGRSRKKAESYAQMERKRRERYEAPLVYESDDDEDDDMDEKREVEAERLVEQLGECEDMEAEEDKENRPPATDSCFPWDDHFAMVRRMAEEAELRKRQRRG